MKYSLSIIVIIIILFTFSLGGVSFAFTGPGSLTPGTGNGALQVDSNLNIGFGTNLATPTGDATNANFGRVFTIASTSDPGISLRNLGGGRNYTMYSRANGRFVIWDDSAMKPRFFLDPNGYVGIPGNSTSSWFFSPVATLDVNGGVHVNGSLQIEAAFTGQIAPSSITGGAFQSTNYSFPSALGVGTSTTSGFPTNGLYIAGNVGIGTISPGAKLHIYGEGATDMIKMTANYGTPQVWTQYVDSGGWYLKQDATFPLHVHSGGNVGIGTINPFKKLDIDLGSTNSEGLSIRGDLDTLGNYVGLRFGYTGASNTYQKGAIYYEAQDGNARGKMHFALQGSANNSNVALTDSKMTIDYSGNVGIGTTAPAGKLDVQDGTGTQTAGDLLVDATNHNVYVGQLDTLADNTKLIVRDRLGNAKMTIDSAQSGHITMGLVGSGNVGIGVAVPGQKLSVAGVIESTTGGIKFPDGTTQVTAGGGTGNSVGWSRTGTNVFLSTSTDWVGIGTSTPTQALDVRGNLYVSGNITTGGTMTTNVGASNVSAGSFGTTAGKGNYRFEGAATTNDVLKIDATNERVGVGTASPMYTMQVGQNTAGIDTNYGIGILRNGTNVTPGTYDNAALDILDWAGDGPTSGIDGVGVLAVRAGRIADGDTYASNASLVRISNDNGGAMRIDGKRNTFIGYMTDAASTQTAGLFVNGNVGVGTTGPGSKLHVVGVTSLGVGGTVPGSSTTGLNLTAVAGSAGTASTGIYFGGDGVAHANIAWMPNERNFILRTGNSSTQTTDSYGGANLVVNGKIGIGTTNPGTSLEVLSIAPDANRTIPQNILTITSQQNNAPYSGFGGGILFKDQMYNLGINNSARIRTSINYDGYVGQEYGGSLAFDVTPTVGGALTEAMRIRYNGNVGIGTTTPTNALDVVGNIRATGNIISGGTMTANVGAGNVSAGTFGITAGKGNYTFEAAANTNNVLKVDATNERVGIGTGSPATKLHVNGSSASSFPATSGTTQTGSYARMQNTDSNLVLDIGGNGGNGVWLQSTNSTGLNNNYAMLLNPNGGNVGVGTTTPSQKLHLGSGSVAVSGADGTTGYMLNSSNMALTQNSSNMYVGWVNNGNNTNYVLSGDKIETVGSSERMRITSTGNVGIGTSTPVSRFSVQESRSVSTNAYGSMMSFTPGYALNNLETAAIYAKNSFSGGANPYHSGIIGESYFTGNYGNNYLAGVLGRSIYENNSAGLYMTGTQLIGLKGEVTAQGTGNSTIPSSFGLYTSGSVVSGSTMTNYYDAYFAGVSGAGTVTNRWGLYQASASAKNFFAGNIGIGTTTPTNALDVVGNIRATGNIIAGGTMTANVSAPNVSAGTFGTTAGKGNYTFEAAANTNNVLKVDATNERVGIGTAAPESLLHLKASNGVTGVLKIEGGNDNVVAVGEINSQLDFGSNDTSVSNTGNVGGRIASVTEYNNGAFAGLAFYTFQQSRMPADLAEVMRITNAGNVGIGVTTPTYHLESRGGAAGGNVMFIEGNNQTNGTGVRLVFSGNSYNGILSVAAATVGTGGSAGINFDSYTTNRDASIFVDESDSQKLKINVNKSTDINAVGGGTNAVTIDTSGNVGVGTTNPSALLTLGANVNALPTNTKLWIAGSGGTSNTILQSRISLGFNNNMDYGGYIGDINVDSGVTHSILVLGTRRGGTDVDAMYLTNGNVGIATSSPAYKLAVNGTGYFANPVVVGSPTDNSHATTKSYVDSLVTGGATSGNLATLIVTGTTTLASTGGKVIIGGAGPALKLDVTGQGQFTDTMSATKYYDYNDTAYYLDPANTGTSLKLAGSLESGGSGTSYVLGNTLIGVSTNPGSYKFAVSGTSYFNNQVTIAANLLMGASQNITLQSGNITGVNKITAAVIDPLYEIDGEKYATYGSDTVGVKTELFAKGTLAKISNSQCSISNQTSNINDSIDTSLKTENCKLQNSEPVYSYVIDFAKAEKGSDLWVFWQTIKEGNDMKDITLTLTPEGKRAELWYELNPKEKQVVVYGDAPVTFSYHLVAPRHDAETWTTKRGKTEEKASFILKAR